MSADEYISELRGMLARHDLMGIARIIRDHDTDEHVLLEYVHGQVRQTGAGRDLLGALLHSLLLNLNLDSNTDTHAVLDGRTPFTNVDGQLLVRHEGAWQPIDGLVFMDNHGMEVPRTWNSVKPNSLGIATAINLQSPESNESWRIRLNDSFRMDAEQGSRESFRWVLTPLNW